MASCVSTEVVGCDIETYSFPLLTRNCCAFDKKVFG